MSSSKLDRKNLLLCSVLSFSVAAAFPGYAQENATDEEELDTVEEVLVTGIRSSIRSSLDLKKNETSIIEAITAEDIGKLPDLSIADSLARLPGVAAQRVRGRSQQISIRGLGPQFSLGLLNGREQVTVNNNRGIEFDQFPSELIAQGVVYKSPDATLAATGVAGSVDLRTVKPLDYEDRKINASGKYVWNSNGSLNPDFDNTGYRTFASYIDQNAEGTLGWYVGATLQTNPTQFTSRELKTNNGSRENTEDGQVRFDPATGLIYPADNPRTGVVSRDFERTSVAGALQFEPNDRFEAVFDVFYTDTEDAGIFRGVETPIASWSGATLDNTTGNGPVADTVTFNDVVPILRTDTESSDSEVLSAGLNLAYNINDRLTLSFDYGHSEAERADIDYESYAGTGPGRSGAQDTLTIITDPNGEYSFQNDLDYTDPANVFLTDPGGWGQVGYINIPFIEDELDQIRLEADYEIDAGFISGLKSGVIFTDREKDYQLNGFFLRPGTAWQNGQLAIPNVVGATDSDSINLDIIAYDPSNFRFDPAIYNVDFNEFGGTAWNLEEDLTTLYAMADVDTQLGNMPLVGNFGFQYVDVEQKSFGTFPGGIQSIDDEYNHFLPSLNLNLEVSEDNFVRFAAAKTVTRPRLDQLSANQQLNINAEICSDDNGDGIPDSYDPSSEDLNAFTTCYSLSGGNPQLRPYESTSYDLAYERYFGETSALSIALFAKELDNWVIDPKSALIDATQELTALGQGDFIAENPNVALVTVSGPVNITEGSIAGIEMAARIDLDDLVGETRFSGLGMSASYTRANNSIKDPDSQASVDIPGYSKEVFSTDFYYENHGWRAKLSARYRSSFLAEVLKFDGSLENPLSLSETVVDAQLGYEWDSGPLEGFSVNFEAYNLTDEAFGTQEAQFDASGNDIGFFPSRYEQYGTTYNFTIAKKF